MRKGCSDMKRLALLLMMSIVLIMAACQQEAQPAPENDAVEKESDEEVSNEDMTKPDKEQVGKEETGSEEIKLADLFMKDGTEAKFAGEGNEFAPYTAKTEWLNDRFVNVSEDNGGTVMLRTFRIDDDKIVVVREEGESGGKYNPSDEELDELEPLYTFLQLPLDKDSTFDGWTVTDNAMTLETPLQKFKDVIVIKKENADGSANYKYFAKDYGEIKREFIMKEGEDDPFIVTSIIEKIN